MRARHGGGQSTQARRQMPVGNNNKSALKWCYTVLIDLGKIISISQVPS